MAKNNRQARQERRQERRENRAERREDRRDFLLERAKLKRDISLDNDVTTIHQHIGPSDAAHEAMMTPPTSPEKPAVLAETSGKLGAAEHEVTIDLGKRSDYAIVDDLHQAGFATADILVNSKAILIAVGDRIEAEKLTEAMSKGAGTPEYDAALKKLQALQTRLATAESVINNLNEDLNGFSESPEVSHMKGMFENFLGQFNERPIEMGAYALAAIVGGGFIWSNLGDDKKKILKYGAGGAGLAFALNKLYGASRDDGRSFLQHMLFDPDSATLGTVADKYKEGLNTNNEHAFRALMKLKDVDGDALVSVFEASLGPDPSTREINPNQLVAYGLSAQLASEMNPRGLYEGLEDLMIKAAIVKGGRSKTESKETLLRLGTQVFKEHYTGSRSMKFQAIVAELYMGIPSPGEVLESAPAKGTVAEQVGEKLKAGAQAGASKLAEWEVPGAAAVAGAIGGAKTETKPEEKESKPESPAEKRSRIRDEVFTEMNELYDEVDYEWSIGDDQFDEFLNLRKQVVLRELNEKLDAGMDPDKAKFEVMERMHDQVRRLKEFEPATRGAGAITGIESEASPSDLKQMQERMLADMLEDEATWSEPANSMMNWLNGNFKFKANLVWAEPSMFKDLMRITLEKMHYGDPNVKLTQAEAMDYAHYLIDHFSGVLPVDPSKPLFEQSADFRTLKLKDWQNRLIALESAQDVNTWALKKGKAPIRPENDPEAIRKDQEAAEKNKLVAEFREHVESEYQLDEWLSFDGEWPEIFMSHINHRLDRLIIPNSKTADELRQNLKDFDAYLKVEKSFYQHIIDSGLDEDDREVFPENIPGLGEITKLWPGGYVEYGDRLSIRLHSFVNAVFKSEYTFSGTTRDPGRYARRLGAQLNSIIKDVQSRDERHIKLPGPFVYNLGVLS